MPTFDYNAADASGRRLAGQIEAPSEQAALRQLTDGGLFPIDVTVARANTKKSAARGGRALARPADITLFTRELALLLGAGLKLGPALATLEAEKATPRIATVATRLRASITSGVGIADAMAAEPATFPPIYVGMVKAAEASSKLQPTLARIADAREREHALASRVTSALIYPSMLIVTAFATVLFLLLYVVPRFRESLGDEVLKASPSAMAVVGVSDWLQSNGWWLAVAVIIGLVGLALAARNRHLRMSLEQAAFRLPLIGGLMRIALTARFCRTLGILMSNGLGLPAALALTRDVVGNRSAEALIDRLSAGLRIGSDFAETLAKSEIFPPMVGSLLRVGEESGTIAVSAEKLADMYEAKLDTGLQRTVALVQPVIILLVSVFIGFIVLSIIGAITSVYDLAGV